MIRNLCLMAMLLAFSLTGCSSPAPKKAPAAPPPPPPATQPTTKTEPPTPEVPKPDAPKADTPKPAEPGAAEKKEEPKKEEPKKEEPKKAEPAKATSIKMVPLGKETGFEAQDASGKSIRGWISALESDNKEQVLEALAVYQMVGKKGAIAMPKVEFLTNSNDAEIATEARAALQALRTKD
jgi:outer membrane biosynthesis protein TonB